jgi:hypothetical protein
MVDIACVLSFISISSNQLFNKLLPVMQLEIVIPQIRLFSVQIHGKEFPSGLEAFPERLSEGAVPVLDEPVVVVQIDIGLHVIAEAIF